MQFINLNLHYLHNDVILYTLLSFPSVNFLLRRYKFITTKYQVIFMITQKRRIEKKNCFILLITLAAKLTDNKISLFFIFTSRFKIIHLQGCDLTI